jgi:hypothetical protein
LAPVASLPSATVAKIGSFSPFRAFPGLAALLRVDAADHLRAVIGQRLLGVEGAGLAGQALNQDLGVFVDENGHGLRIPSPL